MISPYLFVIGALCILLLIPLAVLDLRGRNDRIVTIGLFLWKAGAILVAVAMIMFMFGK
jgi:hypothetical protein